LSEHRIAEVLVRGSGDSPDVGPDGPDVADGDTAVVGDDPLDVVKRRGSYAARLAGVGAGTIASAVFPIFRILRTMWTA